MTRPSATAVTVSWLALLAAFSAAADQTLESADPPAVSAAPPQAPAPVAAEPGPVEEITLDPTVKPPVCRRYFPTGSRIATERCQSAEATTVASEAERNQMRRDLEEMRMRQAAREQARAAAQAEAMRRRAGF